MLDNKVIVERVRKFGQLAGVRSDAAICEKCGIGNRMALKNVQMAKTSPQVGTLNKFARGLGVRIEDLIYNTTDVDREMARVWTELSEYEKTETVVYAKMMIKEKNEKQRKIA